MTVYPERFIGRTAIITGGASGVGLQTAMRIIAEGGRVSLWDQNAEALTAAHAQTGGHVQRVDVSDHGAVAAAAAASNAALGRIDILVVGAGITGPTVPVIDYPAEGWRRVIDVNLNGAFYSCREVVPFMQVHHYGRIVIVASVAGKEGNPNASAYSASKAGMIALTKSLGKELAQGGIRVNAVTPAAFESPLFSQMPQSHLDYMKSKIPMGRLGTMAEVAATICWLASEECSFSTAAVFDISGGRSTY